MFLSFELLIKEYQTSLMRMKRELYEIQFKYKALKAKVEKSRKENDGLKIKLKKSYMAQKNVTLDH